jgi:hypothetical protein
MKKLLVLLLILLAVPLSSVKVKAQQTGETDEEIKKEITKLEQDKIPILLKGGPTAAEWWERVNTDDVIASSASDGSISTKADNEAAFRTNKRVMGSVNLHDILIHVYNKDTVVFNCLNTNSSKGPDGKFVTHTIRQTDVWVKRDGKWLRVLHAS